MAKSERAVVVQQRARGAGSGKAERGLVSQQQVEVGQEVGGGGCVATSRSGKPAGVGNRQSQ